MFATLAAFISPLVFADTMTWDALDFARCSHWSLTDEVGPAAQKQVQPLLIKQGKEWFAVEASNFTEHKSYVGVCRFTDGELTRMDCLGGDELKAFPIAGTTFVMSNFRTGPTQPLPTYKCATGCAGAAINMLYQKPYEDGGDNMDFVKAYQRFRKQCPKAK